MMNKYVHKLVKITTIYNKEILCIILNCDDFRFLYKSDFGYGLIRFGSIKHIDIIGDLL